MTSLSSTVYLLTVYVQIFEVVNFIDTSNLGQFYFRGLLIGAIRIRFAEYASHWHSIIAPLHCVILHVANHRINCVSNHIR